MKLNNYLLLFFVFLVLAFFYKSMETKDKLLEEIQSTDAIQRYLSGDIPLHGEKLFKPILWIPILFEYNARNWLSFGSRSSMELNQPYLYITIKSILQRCNDSFHICIIDDASFAKLLPEWNISMHKVSAPISTKLRFLGWMKLLYKYGGMICPPSFLCMQDLFQLYERGIQGNKFFLTEMVNRNITSTSYLLYPNIEFCGAPKECPVVQKLCDFMQRIISTDFTAQSEFLGDFNRWCLKKQKQNQLYVVDGKYIGTKMEDDTPILIEHLMSNNYLHLGKEAYGIYIPSNELLQRRKYEWFARLSAKQALTSNTILGNYLLLAGAEQFTNDKLFLYNGEPTINEQIEKKYVGFWDMPSGAPVWGLKPIDVGNNVRRVAYPS